MNHVHGVLLQHPLHQLCRVEHRIPHLFFRDNMGRDKSQIHHASAQVVFLHLGGEQSVVSGA